MKISIKVECTPDEARKFLGMPDVSAANEVFARSFSEKMAEAVDGIDVDALIKGWMPGAVPGMEDVQKAFWEQFGMAAPGKKPKK